MVQENSIAKYNCIIVLGPTSSGKSDVAIKLAQRYNGNIVNCDSQQIYKGISIGTAKPSKDDFDLVKHHLFDYVDLGEDYSVSRFYDDAIRIFTELTAKNILPVFVGGTGFYIDSLLYKHDYGFSDKDSKIREKYLALAEKKGNLYLHEMLEKIDPITAEKLHPNDTKRIIRALEIADSGKLKSSQKILPNDVFKPYIIHVDTTREKLYDRINLRVDKMMSNGLFSEVEKLHSQGYFDKEIKLPIGYSEWKEYYAKRLDFDQVVELIKQHTRNYAKRQKTWFRRVICTIEYDPMSNTMQDIFTSADVYFKK